MQRKAPASEGGHYTAGQARPAELRPSYFGAYTGDVDSDPVGLQGETALAAGRDDPREWIVEGAGGNARASREWQLRIWKVARSTEICVFSLMRPIPCANRVFVFAPGEFLKTV